MGAGQRVYVSPAFRQVCEGAQQEAEQLKDEYVSTEHFLLVLVDNPGRAGQSLRQAGVSRDRLYQALQEVSGGQRITSQNAETTYQSLEKYGRDLTTLAQQGKLDPVIGPEEEIRRTREVV